MAGSMPKALPGPTITRKSSALSAALLAHCQFLSNGASHSFLFVFLGQPCPYLSLLYFLYKIGQELTMKRL